ncbi:MAG: winged helix-turn-helix domain-containing protein [Dehalogenimonas sp.]
MSDIRILWIGNNQTPLSETMSFVEQAGYEIAKATNTIEGINQLFQARTDLIVLEAPSDDKTSSEQLIRFKQLAYTPIIVLGDANKANRMLELGADCYVDMPPDARELAARISSILRRKKRTKPPSTTNTGMKSNEKLDNNQKLSQTENRITTCLEHNRGRVISYSSLLDVMSKEKSISLDTLHHQMRRLKAKLWATHITQVRGVGYLMA